MNFEKVKNSLEKNGYIVSVFESAAEAADYMVSRIKEKTVGIGGSMTVREMGLYERLTENNDVFWHWEKRDGLSEDEIRERAMTTDVYISSVNGLAETGEIINIDGNCNRLAGVFYGHKKVYLIAGINKLEENYEKALYRARNVASPMNAKRLGAKTPCAAEGNKCYDCNSPGRICKGLSVLLKKPGASGCEYEVVLVNEKLGY